MILMLIVIVILPQIIVEGGWRNKITLPLIERLGIPIVHTWNLSVPLWQYHHSFQVSANCLSSILSRRLLVARSESENKTSSGHLHEVPSSLFINLLLTALHNRQCKRQLLCHLVADKPEGRLPFRRALATGAISKQIPHGGNA